MLPAKIDSIFLLSLQFYLFRIEETNGFISIFILLKLNSGQ